MQRYASRRSFAPRPHHTERGGALQRLGILDRKEGDFTRSHLPGKEIRGALEGGLLIADVIDRNALGSRGIAH